MLYLQKQNLHAKLESQMHFLKQLEMGELDRELDQCIKGLQRYKERIDQQNDKRDLLRIEAEAGQLYFRHYTSLSIRNMGFNSRNGGGIKTGNRYASDVINALLNYGYSVLAAEIAKFVHGYGLDPYYGFFHKIDTSFQALVCDLIEPFRWLVECAVYKLAVEGPTHGRVIKKYEYAWTREGKVILDSAHPQVSGIT